MQAAFLTRDERAFSLVSGLPGAHGMAETARHGMGRAWTDSPVRPRAAVVTVGDFLFCGGQPGPSAAHLLRMAIRSEKRGWLVDAPGAWKAALDKVAPNTPCTRYAFDRMRQPEDAHLRRVVGGMPEGLRFQRITGEWIARCRGAAWSRENGGKFSAR